MRYLIIICICILINSCDYDQVENKYNDYNAASKDDFLIKGWIPENIIRESMSEICIRSNLDLNTCIFSFKLSQPDLDSIKCDLKETEIEFKKPRRIKISKSWIENVRSLNHRFYTIDFDTVFISIDTQKSKVYGWRN